MATSIEISTPSAAYAADASTETAVASKVTIARRHDLDSLRAIAMLLGIVLHAAMSFTSIPWPVGDSQQSNLYELMFAAIHGFRMPLFFLVSGFFTAMLWRKRGLGGLIRQRLKRIVLPLFLGCLTIVPAMWAVNIFVSQRPSVDAGTEYFDAIAAGDTETLREAISANKIAIDALHPASGSTMLTVATFGGQPEIVEMLLDQGADVNQRNGDGGTALHTAAFMGNAEEAKLLIDAGADVEAKDASGRSPKDNLTVDFGTTSYIATMYGESVEEDELNAGRAEIAEMLGLDNTEASAAAGLDALYGLFFLLPVYMHLWFLAFLCWLVIAFVAYASIANFVNFKRIPKWIFCSPLSLLWLVPLTMLPQYFMQPGTFGPDGSIGLLPIPSVLAYYAIFFFFGVVYWDLDDTSGKLGRWWFIGLPVALFIVFPVGLDLVMGTFGFLPEKFGGSMKPMLGNLLQALFVWLMVFGSIGMFRDLFSGESKAMRYVSDSSYWLYLAHLPLVILAQWLVKDWPIPAVLKLVGIIVVVSAFLLLTYEYLIRYTIIGTMLNGPKKRKAVSVGS
ncbi:acyltransferase family protein [Mariniblastus fucicola]|uniref:Glucans biosynthesis protein C n=1 Tax=Mariniblastus fucicola TaxID=980251 RepID=A0A5B9P5E7_9BACT|nr:acyltransferase family protein [Mariniblastus fucicola]QEG21618.1 Glucans biosynthesis protein C [Mariniblastus fucicola]